MWATQLGGAGRDNGHGVAVNGNDEIVIVGEFSDSLNVADTTLTSAGGSDIYVMKVASATGEIIWAKRFGGAGNDVGGDVAIDESNSIYVTGHFIGSVDFGGGTLTSGTQDDAFVLKLGDDGSFGWARKLGGDKFDVGQGIAARGSAVTVVGFFNGSMTIDTTTLTSAGQADIFVASMATADGATNWAKRFGGSLIDNARAVEIDNANNVVLTGDFAGTVNFGGGAMSTPGDFSDVLLLKLAGSDGAHLLSQHYGGVTHDFGNSVAVDASNNIYITGEFGETASFGCPDPITASQPNETDVFLVKYTQAFSCTWAKGFGGTGTFDRSATGVTVNANGVAIAGSFCGSMSFGGPTLTAAGSCAAQDMFAARFTLDGEHLNSARAGGTGSEFSAGIAQSSDGRFYVTGKFEGAAEFGGTLFSSAGGDDGFLVGLEAL